MDDKPASFWVDQDQHRDYRLNLLEERVARLEAKELDRAKKETFVGPAGPAVHKPTPKPSRTEMLERLRGLLRLPNDLHPDHDEAIRWAITTIERMTKALENVLTEDVGAFVKEDARSRSELK